MDELFDVFDDKPQSEIPEKPKKAKKEKKDKSKKRTANGDVKKDQDGDAEMVDTEQGAEVAEGETDVLVEKKDTKRRRREEDAEPVVTDTFQTEQSREVAASAGLQGKDDGALVIQHNIQHINPPRSQLAFGPSS
jgi:ATP-dependent RNA helicase DOB1